MSTRDHDERAADRPGPPGPVGARSDDPARAAVRAGTQADPAEVRAFAIEAARLLDDRKCEDVVLLDVRTLSEVCDYVIVGTGTSDRQMRSVADELADEGKARGHACFSTAKDSAATWIVVDFVDVVVHLFEPSQRAYYDLESLWSDAPEIAWARPD